MRLAPRVYSDVPHYERVCAMMAIALTPEQRKAFWYLEQNGQRFCTDFGIHNAVKKAETLRHNKGLR